MIDPGDTVQEREVREVSLKKIGICHYRVGRTDGVSLEIARRREVLMEMGHEVLLVSGPVQDGSDVIIPELEFDSEEILRIKRNAFGPLVDFSTEQQLMDDIHRAAARITRQLLDMQRIEHFDLLFVHNIFSHGRHVAAAKGFADFLNETNTACVAVHHDLYSSYGDLYRTPHRLVQTYLDRYVPPSLPGMKHVVINSLDRARVAECTGTDVTVLPDILDFNQEPWVRDDFNSDFLQALGVRENDLLLLQATRIVERKAVEVAVDFAAVLQSRLPEFVRKSLYNGKQITEKSRLIILLPGIVEPASEEYYHRLQAYCLHRNVEARFYGGRTGARRLIHEDGSKQYTLWDSYAFADMVTYPSIREGWGNQFLEAVFAQRPVVLFEYPVFIADIRPEGYEYISLGDTFECRKEDGMISVPDDALEAAVDKAVDMLCSPATADMLSRNFRIGREKHGMDVLRETMHRLVGGR